MFCHLTRRLISRSEDQGKQVPRFAERHAARCPACRDYARFAGSLKERLSAERPGFLAAVPDFPLNEIGETEAEPKAGGRKREIFGRKIVAHPLPLAAAGLVVVAGAVILFRAVLREAPPSAEERTAALAGLRSLTAAPSDLGGIVAEAESALAKEREILERSVVSAFEYLQARLNVKTERRDPAAKTV